MLLVTSHRWVDVTCDQSRVGGCYLRPATGGWMLLVTSHRWVDVTCDQPQVGECLHSYLFSTLF